MVSWDKRMPVSVEQIGKFTVTIYDLEAYEQSKIDYPDDADQPARKVRTDNDKPTFAKKKPASRWNWIVKPKQPLRGRTA
ncbi:MAG TPA: hypothetical protein VHV10_01285 [Ktedonobacteraceae bacterium]|jgi:hypothetical protein|nr:hypothetical protein [Ktedonobacteraceae bacterium]